MNGNLVQIVALAGWLVLAIAALSSFRLSGSKALRMALIWIAIFGGAALLFAFLGG